MRSKSLVRHSTWKKAAKWAAEQFRQRTIAVARGARNEEWLDPQDRVKWEEVLVTFPELRGEDPVDEFYPRFERELADAGLLGVRKGTVDTKIWARTRGVL